MRLYEVSGKNADLDRALASVNKQMGGAWKRPDPAKAAKDAETAAKLKKVEAKRASIKAAAGEIAAQASNFDEFVSMAQEAIPLEDLEWIDLNHTFRSYNQAEKDQAARGWEDYGKQRDAGKVQGRGTGSKRNWTGD